MVNITADYTPKEADLKKDPNGDGDDDALEPFKRFFHGGGGDSPHAFKHEQSGSGFIVDRNGYILTNNHVVDKMDHIRVKLHTETTEYRARLIGFRPRDGSRGDQDRSQNATRPGDHRQLRRHPGG